MSWRGGIKRDKTDTVFSWLIRERADWTCHHCGLQFRNNPNSLHCSHIFTRSMKGLRWHPLNALAHCQRCHEYLERNPLVFADHVRDVMGGTEYAKLRVMARKPTKLTKFEKELIHKHLLGEKKRLQALRNAGAKGLLAFTLP